MAGFSFELGVALALLLLFVGVVAVLVIKSIRRVGPGQALVIHKIRRADVSFVKGLAFPIVHRAWLVDLRIPDITCDCTGARSLSCRDGVRVDLRAIFELDIQHDRESVLRVVSSLGLEGIANEDAIPALFEPKFLEALQTVAATTSFEMLLNDRQAFSERVFEVTGQDLNGVFLEEITIDHLELTAVEHYDPAKILDARGSLALTQLNAAERASLREKEKSDALAAAERAQEFALGGTSR